jgi:hypothetical protein
MRAKTTDDLVDRKPDDDATIAGLIGEMTPASAAIKAAKMSR